MSRAFDPEVIKTQIANLLRDRDQIDETISALQAALRSIEGLTNQVEFAFTPPPGTEVTLQDAVKKVCLRMIDGITRQRVILAVEKEYAYLKPKSSSVSAALINLSKGEEPMLKIAIEGQGRRPTMYSTESTLVIQLSSDEIEELVDPRALQGTGGWQSLWSSLLKKFDKATASISLDTELRGRLYHYFHSYGVGGWQAKVKRVFRRQLPHLFAT